MKRCPLFRRSLLVFLLALAALSLAAVACGSKEAERVEGLARVRIGDLTVNAEAPQGEGFYRCLGGRESLPDERGMLFVFPSSQRHGIWMKDMLIPIDIIWISAEGRVVDIQTAQPEPGVPDEQLKRYHPREAAQYVLEVRAGLAAEKGVEVGDKAEIELP